MKPESLETLFIDRALGELTPEAAELLDAWSRQNPAASSASAAVASTVQIARAATAATSLPPAPLPPPAWRRNRWHRAELLRLAACVALGAGVATLAPDFLRRTPAHAAPPTMLAAPPATPATASRLWSVSARIEASQSRASEPARTPATSPAPRSSLLKLPRFDQ